ncbi:MAG TPA: carbohydrate ABC transporter permease [Clostridia bacterium]|nr:carbohydrate ABC transporter permease [Clostridia bacterium]
MFLPGVNADVAVVQETEMHVRRTYTRKQRLMHFLRSNTTRRYIYGFFRNTLLIGLAFVVLFPLFSKFSNSLKPTSEMFDSTVVFIPKAPTLDNYRIVIKYMDYWNVLGKTAFSAFYLSVIQAIICTIVAYGFARFKFPGRNILFTLVIATVVIPQQALIFPLIVRFQFFGFKSLLWVSEESIKGGISLMAGPLPLILLSLSGVAFRNGLFIYLLRQYFKNIPKELEEAAFIDGAGFTRTFFKVMLPGAVPLMMTVFLFSFVWLYNDDFYWRALQSDARVMSVQVQTVARQIIQAITNQPGAGSQYGFIMQEVYKQAAVMLHIAPLTLLYIFTQKFFVQSIERSGLVG